MPRYYHLKMHNYQFLSILLVMHASQSLSDEDDNIMKCGKCGDKAIEKQTRIDQVTEIVNQEAFESPDSITKEEVQKATEKMADEIKALKQLTKDHTPIEIFGGWVELNFLKGTDACKEENNTWYYSEYDFSNITKGDKVFIRLSFSELAMEFPVTINISGLTVKMEESSKPIVAKLTDQNNSTRFYHVEITSLVDRIVSKPKHYKGLTFRISSQGKDFSDGFFTAPEQTTWIAVNPLDEARSRRSIVTSRRMCTDRSAVTCCLYEADFSIDSVGWNYILSPLRIPANYCHGRCNFNQMRRSHASLITEGIFPDVDWAASEARCCIPKQYATLPLMYIDKDGNPKVRNIDNFIITDCMCA